MKAFYLSIFPNTRSWNGVLYPWKDGAILRPSNFPGIIATGPLSQCGNRSCTHMTVDVSDLPPCDVSSLNVIPYKNDSYPALRYRSTVKGWNLSSKVGDSQESYWEYIFSTTRTIEKTRVYSSANVVTLWKRSERYERNVLVYYWEGFRRFTITAFLASAPYHETYTMYNSGVTTYGENSGNIAVNWFDFASPDPDYSIFKPEVFFSSIQWRSLMSRAYMQDIKSFGELSSDAMDSFYGDVNNGIQYSIEMTQLGSLAAPLRQIAASGLSVGKLASSYLAYEYGLRLTAKDTFAYISQIKKNRNMRSLKDYSRCYARDVVDWTNVEYGIDAKFTRNLTLFYVNATDFLVRSSDALRKWGFMPSTEIAWDIVPFSFIVDWFVPVGESLNAFDKQGIFDSHTFLEHIATDKLQYSIDWGKFSPSSNVQGTVHVTAYFRTVAPNAPRPSIRFDDFDLSMRQIRNGGAILLQSWRK